MVVMKLFAALLLSALALANADILGIVQPGKELVFDWETFVETGTEQPLSFSSDFRLKAKLHVQGIDKTVVGVRLDNILHHVSNGAVKPIDPTDTFLPIPKEAEYLKLPFLVRLDANGIVTGIVVDKSDKEWSINIKKSLASLLQVDTKQLLTDKIDKKIPYLSVTNEQTVHGFCEVKYDVQPGTDLILAKSIDLKMCKDVNKIIKNDEMLGIDSSRIYKFTLKDGHLHMKSLFAVGDIIVTSNRGKSDVNYVKIVQKFFFVEEVAIGTKITISEEVDLRTLKVVDMMNKCREMNTLTTIFDITGGRRVIKKDLITNKILTSLDELIEFIDQNHITLTKPDAHKVHLVQKILVLLEELDLDTLEHLLVGMEEKTDLKDQRKYQVLVQLLPHVGTRVSMVLIRNLIRKNKIDEDLAVLVLPQAVGSLHCPNEKLLSEMEDLLTLGGSDINKRLNRVGILTFAGLIKKTFVNMDDKNHGVVEKYIQSFMEKIKNSDDYLTKMTYLQALSNIGCRTVLKQLEPILTGEMVVDNRVRVMTLWCMSSILTHDVNLMMKIVWPILTNYRADDELRLAAYIIFIKTEKPTVNRFLNLLWLMKNEWNSNLYRYHYNTMVNLSEMKCTNDIECRLAEICRIIVRLSHRPFVTNHWDGYHIRDFLDVENGLGARLKYTLMHTKHVTLLKLKSFMKISTNFEFPLLEANMRIVNNNKNTVGPALSSHSKLWSKDKFTVELVIRRKGLTVFVDVLDGASISTILKAITDLDVTQKKDKLRNLIDMPSQFNALLISDLGVPVRLFARTPIIRSVKVNVNTESAGGMQIDFKAKGLSVQCIGIVVYNPVNDLWHGIEQMRTTAAALPMNMAYTFKPDTGALNIVMKKVGTDDVIGFQQYVQTETFIGGPHSKEILARFDKDAQVNEMVVRGKDYLKKITLCERTIPDIGKKVEVMVFDCDRDVTRAVIMTKMQDFLKNHFVRENFDHSLFIVHLLRLRQLFMVPSKVGSCGLGIRILPLENVDRIEIDAKLKMTEFGDDKQKLLLKPLDVTVTAMTVIKGTDNTDLVTYDTKISLKLEELHRNLELKWTTLQKQLGKDKFTLDFDLSMKLHAVDVEGKFKLVFGLVNKLNSFDIVFKGKRSEEQKLQFNDKKVTIDECRREILRRQVYGPLSVECISHLTTLRHYLIDMTINELHKEDLSMLFELLKLVNFQRTNIIDAEDRKKNMVKDLTIGEDDKQLHIDLSFPLLQEDEIDIKVESANKGLRLYTLTLPKMELFRRCLGPDNLFYSTLFIQYLIETNAMQTCIVAKHAYLTQEGMVIKKVTESDWLLYLKGVNEKDMYTVEVKRLEDIKPKVLALRVKLNDDILEVIPVSATDCKTTLNGKEVTLTQGQYEKHSGFELMMIPHPKVLILRTNLLGLNIVFDGETVRILSSTQLLENQEGLCIGSTNE